MVTIQGYNFYISWKQGQRFQKLVSKKFDFPELDLYFITLFHRCFFIFFVLINFNVLNALILY